jgi:hypothetical protein
MEFQPEIHVGAWAQTALNFDSAAKKLWGSCFPGLGVVTITGWTAYLDRVSK